MGGSYAFFEHTADIGIQAEGATQEEFFVAMARGLAELIAENTRVEPEQTKAVCLSAEDAEGLLLAWLQKLLYWFSTERFLVAEYRLARISPTALAGEVRGGTFDPARDTQGREVKAITRHQLNVRQQEDRWSGRVIVDI